MTHGKLRCLIISADDGKRYAMRLLERLHSEFEFNVKLRIYEHRPDDWTIRARDIIDGIDVVVLIGTALALNRSWLLAELQLLKDHRRLIVPVIFREQQSPDEIPHTIRDLEWAIEGPGALARGPSRFTIQKIVDIFAEGTRSQPPVSKSAAQATEEKRKLNEGKLILVGRGEVGKTSIVRRLSGRKFRDDEFKTQGINITRLPIRCGEDDLSLNVWDFGGQEIMHATHQFFLTEQSIYLLVLNGREGGEDADAEYWLKHIESFGGDSPIIVIQNKVSQHPFELNYRGLKARYPQIKEFIKTDCKDDVGVDEIKAAISKIAADMPEIRTLFPISWFKVKERLESMNGDFMSCDQFSRLCSEQGIEDEKDRTTLSWALHCLGIALNYRDDWRLRETSVLKPEWVTKGIYKIINGGSLTERQGELRVSNLQNILPTELYPPNKHHFLLGLMRKFSLCFPFPNDDDRYLVPELLGKEEPEEIYRFHPDSCLNFEYHYGVLPEGLIPRFIVRSHTLSEDQQRWRSGVILSHEGCKALVTADQVSRRILVRVKGEKLAARRRLLAIIRYDIDKINAEFKDLLDAHPKVPLTRYPEFSVDYKKLVAFEDLGVKEFPEIINGALIIVKVKELLDGVDLDDRRDNELDVMANAKSLFFSYSHKDEGLRNELETHLKLLQRQGIISTWHDRKIPPGNDWEDEINQYLERAKIILLLISPDFLASDYCWGKEVKVAMERHAAGDATVIPIMLRSCDWDKAPFAKLQGLPKDMKAVTIWDDRDSAWTDVAVGIRAIAKK